MSRIPEGATHFNPLDVSDPFRCQVKGQWCYWRGGSWFPFISASPDKYAPISEHPDYAAPTPAWDGSGLPPVGIDIEFLCGTEGKWLTGRVIGHDEKYNAKAAIVRFENSEGGYEYRPAFEMRPARTPEQIAAEEREKAIDEMAVVYKSNYEGHIKDGCQALYDAGYRKQVQP